jgi:ComF family protein
MRPMRSLLELVVPAACAACGSIGSVVCGDCVGTFAPAGDPRDRFVAADRGIVIGQDLQLAIAAFAYEGAMRRSLQRLKYGGMARVADPLASAAAPAFERLSAIVGDPLLVPVPLHPTRLRQRGYNQARLLADALGAATGLPVEERLIRSRETTRMHGLDRAARLRNLMEAFAATASASPQDTNRTFVIVDDILTTSATLEACASVLARAGCGQVAGFAIAREI